jgi:hydroxymethylpyrimidine/phosphomethylpyrimidine kinase
MPSVPEQVLTIAGSDPGGGAGIAADLKAIHANGGYGLFALTAVTSQNTRQVLGVHHLPASVVRGQIGAIFEDFNVAAVKTGMLGTAATVAAVAEELAAHRGPDLVVDPVIMSTSGTRLLEERGIAELRRSLLPLARICTPNRQEAELLSGMEIADLDDAKIAAARIRELGPRAVLIKGGHLQGEKATDLLMDEDRFQSFESQRIASADVHGAGCVFSAAIATWLGRGLELARAVAQAKLFVTQAIRARLAVGRAHAPTDPLYFFRGRDWSDFA